MSTCKSCGAPVCFAKSASGKWMILNAEPSEDGNVVLDFRPQYGRHDASVFKDAETAKTFAPNEPRYLDHHVTCPQSKDWKAKASVHTTERADS